MSRRQAAGMERRAVPGELSGRRGVATLVRSFPVAVAFPFIVTKHHRDGKRFVARADEKLTAFIDLESAIQCVE